MKPSDIAKQLIEARRITAALQAVPAASKSEQLAAAYLKALEALRLEITTLRSYDIASTHYEGCEQNHPRCRAVKRIQKTLSDLGETL